MISEDEEQTDLTPIFGNPEQYTSQILQRRNDPIQLCQHLQPVADTPESPPPEDQGPRDIFRLYDLLNPSISTSYNNPPPPPPKYLNKGKWVAKFDIAPPSSTQGVGDGVFGLPKII